MNFTDVNIDSEQLGELLEKIPAIEIWIKAIKDRAYNDLNSGRAVPGLSAADYPDESKKEG